MPQRENRPGTVGPGRPERKLLFRAHFRRRVWSASVDPLDEGAPVVGGGLVWVQGSNDAYGLYETTGQLATGTGSLNGPGADTEPAVKAQGLYFATGCQHQYRFTVGGLIATPAAVWVGTAASRLIALNPATGAVMSTYKLPRRPRRTQRQLADPSRHRHRRQSHRRPSRIHSQRVDHDHEVTTSPPRCSPSRCSWSRRS